MSNNQEHVSTRWEEFNSLYTWVAVILLLLLLVLWLLGYGPGGSRCAAPTVAASAQLLTTPTPPPVAQFEAPAVAGSDKTPTQLLYV